MVIRDLYWRRYAIPFRQTFTNRYEQLSSREGALLFLETDGGITGMGDVAPMAGFGGRLEEALRLLSEARPLLLGTAVEERGYWRLSSALMGWGGAPGSVRSVLSGLCLAFFDLIARERGMSLAAYLAHGRTVASTIPVNATLGGATVEELQSEARRAVDRGFRCLKMKVGSARPAADLERVAAVKAIAGAEVTLRVDANGAWTMAEALTILPRLIDAGVALVEQPLAPHHRSGMRMLRERFPAVQIAADESVVDLNAAYDVLRTEAADVLVIKPTAAGGPVDAVMIGARATERGKGVIVTSLLESGVGVAGALHAAAAMPGILPSGLATAELLEGTLVREPLEARDGFVQVPPGPGLGVTLDDTQLHAYCGAAER